MCDIACAVSWPVVHVQQFQDLFGGADDFSGFGGAEENAAPASDNFYEPVGAGEPSDMGFDDFVRIHNCKKIHSALPTHIY